MIKKILPVIGVVFIAAVAASRTDWDEKLMDQIEPLLVTAAKAKAVLNTLS